MTSEMPVKNLLEIIMLFRENAGLRLETTLYDDFAVLYNDKFKIIVMGREKRADNGEISKEIGIDASCNEHGKLTKQDKEAVQDLMAFKARYKNGK